MDKVKISIIMPTYFHEQYIEEALKTILSQKTVYSYEILIVDDCSKDKTLEIANFYKTKYPEIIKVYANEINEGICRNMYKAYLRCKGEYIVLSAGDDYWIDERKLQKQCDFLERNSEYVAEGTVVEGRYSDGEIIKKPHSPMEQYWGKEFTREDFLKGDIYPTSGMMIRNIFLSDRARKQFAHISEFSRDIDDLPFAFFLFDYGRIHISSDITYVIRTRRVSEAKEHNYNTKYRGVNNYIEHLKLLNNINDYYEGKYSLKKWYEIMFQSLIYNIMMGKQWLALKNIKLVPKKYWLEFGINYSKEIFNSVFKRKWRK